MVGVNSSECLIVVNTELVTRFSCSGLDPFYVLVVGLVEGDSATDSLILLAVVYEFSCLFCSFMFSLSLP